MKFDDLDSIDDGDVSVRKTKKAAARQLGMYRNSSEEWMRELARQVDEGVLPQSALDRLPRAMWVKP